MTLVTPADAKGPVPVMMMFGGGGLPGVRSCQRKGKWHRLRHPAPIRPRRSS